MQLISISDPYIKTLAPSFIRNVQNGNILLFKGRKRNKTKNIMYWDNQNNIIGVRATEKPLI